MHTGSFARSLRLFLAAIASAFAAVAGAQPGGQDTSAALVQLKGDPLSTYVQTRPAQGRKIDFDANTVKSYRAQLAALRNGYKAWLRKNVPQARVTGEFDISLNAVAVQLNGATLEQVAASQLVKHAEYQGLYRKTAHDDPDLALISANQAWTMAGGAANAGAGVKVAIVDSGIDHTHPCFNDAGYATQQRFGVHALTNNKVIAARVFNNKTPSLKFTPEAIDSHGTHVAGTVACNAHTPANVDGVAVPYDISGVAPRALLGNYNVFPADTTNARSEDILNALEAAYGDGFDVANMSLGGGSRGIQDLLTMAVDNLDAANMVVAVAAGNSGPGLGTVESPGSAARALTAGASSVPHMMANPINTNNASYAGRVGDFGEVNADIVATLAVVAGETNGLGEGCTPFAPGSLAGRIVLVSRGTCFFTEKVRNIQNAGGIAAIVADNRLGDPVLMGTDGTPNQPTIPALSVSLADGQSLIAANGTAATIDDTPAYFSTPNADIMADFSSQGPTDVDFRVKPDVVAPGVNVLSSVPANACDVPPCFAFFQGTSMATPHLAGSAAVLRAMNPAWSAAEIRSAVVNTAARGVLKAFPTPATTTTFANETNVNIAGAGREDLLAAANATTLLSPVSVSFGAVPSVGGKPASAQVTITNAGSSPVTWPLSVSSNFPNASVTFSVSPSSVTLAPGASTTVTVTMTPARGASFGGHQAMLEVGSAAHAVLYTFIK